MTLAALNLLAFAWHSALDIVEPPWQTARQIAAKQASFFAHILTLTSYVVFPSWSALLQALTTFTIPGESGEGTNAESDRAIFQLVPTCRTRIARSFRGRHNHRDSCHAF
jgi:hypothetical protein